MLATQAHRHTGLPTPAEIRRFAATIRRNWTPDERVYRQYLADLRRESLVRAAIRSAA